MNISEIIKMRFDSLTDAQKSVANTILANPDKILDLSVATIAENANTAPSTVVAFCKRIGCSGINELKYMMNDNKVGNEFENSSLYHAFKSYVKARDSEEFKIAVEMIGNSSSVYIFATQMSQIPAKDFYLHMLKINTHSFFYSDDMLEQLHNARKVTKDDLVLFISNSGESKELVEMSDAVINSQSRKILVTNNSRSSLANRSNVVISAECQENDELMFYEEPTESRYTLILILENIFLTFLKNDEKKARQSIEKIRDSTKLIHK